MSDTEVLDETRDVSHMPKETEVTGTLHSPVTQQAGNPVSTSSSSTQSTETVAPVKSELPQYPPTMFRREFKVSGQIGEPQGKDTLSFGSLLRQLQRASSRGYTDDEIIDGVVKCIKPHLALKSYIEGRKKLSLADIKPILRAHYLEPSATEIYQQLGAATQNPNETANDFLMRVLNLREKVLLASKDDDGIAYATPLVQQMFIRALRTGLRNEQIRQDVNLVLLDISVTDEKLLVAFSKAESLDQERKQKLQPNRPKVHTVETFDATSDQPAATKLPKTPEAVKKTNLQAEMADLRGMVQSLSLNAEGHRPNTSEADETDELKAEVRYLREQLAYERQLRRGYSADKEGPRGTAPRPRWKREWGCRLCVAQGMGRSCRHCFYCGSDSHQIAACPEKKENTSGAGNGDRL